MDHPLLSVSKSTRKRMMNLFSDGLLVKRTGNLVFVCGGNEDDQLRPAFYQYAVTNLPDFEIFQPEFAMDDYFDDAEGAALDLADFEALIGELSHAIVIFPEAPGSYAETGYFANISALTCKTFLVLNADYQANDSFIMMGPARRYDAKSKFYPNLQLNYAEPDFAQVCDRIKRVKMPTTRKSLRVSSEISTYELFCLIYKIIDVLQVATFDDVLFVLRSLFEGHPAPRRARELISVLVGSKFIKKVGDFGHFCILGESRDLALSKDGFLSTEAEVRLEIAALLRGGGQEFIGLLEEMANAD